MTLVHKRQNIFYLCESDVEGGKGINFYLRKLVNLAAAYEQLIAFIVYECKIDVPF